MDGQPLPQHSAAVPHKDEAPTQGHEAEASMTPKGTLLVLLLYAGVIAGLWGFMYVSMLMRR